MSARARTDQNLLFGILALQMDFIGRDALICAMNAWVLDKSKPLSQILFEQGVLAAERRTLLEALVAEHLKQHGNDAEKSLASVSSLGSVRQDLQAIADADIQASLVHVSLARQADGDSLATRPPTVGETTSAGTRFRILRPHAKGGLGEVFVAQDQELNREVALKEIQDRYADHQSNRTRFVLEAEITGGLEHPGIVPVYGLGQYADGRPFYAMRFIKGDSLQEAIQRFHAAEGRRRNPGARALALRDLLGRFVDVCNAIAYAHSRGVLHRDLKPGNIMLGKYGETLVVDWGLAKAVGGKESAEPTEEVALKPLSASDSAPTQMGTAIGTPAFMSPEQAAGRVDQLGPASDIYSLGATLYCLLTGQPAYQGQDVGEVLKAVERGEFASPRRLKRRVPAALEAICLQAMALKPEARYPSAKTLAEDVEHWLADEPVSAYREPWRVRIRRWARHHKPLVSAAAAGMVVATVALVSGLWWWSQQRIEQRNRVEAALVEVARLQREGRWNEARAVLRQTDDQLAKGGPNDLRERLQQARAEVDLVGRLDEIRLKKATIIEGRFDTAGADRAYEQTLREAGMGEVGGDATAAASWVSDSGVREALIEALDDWASCAGGSERRAWLLELCRRVDPDPWRDAVREPAAWDDAATLARLANDQRIGEQPTWLLCVVGARLMVLKRDAEGPLRAALERQPGDFWANFYLGNALSNGNKLEEAMGYYRAALALRPMSSAVHYNFGNALLAKGRLDEAIAQYRKAVEIDPNAARVRMNLGVVLADKGCLDEAIAQYHKAIELDPKDGGIYVNLGKTLYNKGHFDDAIAQCRKAIELDPKDAKAHNNLGAALREKGHLDESIAECRTAIQLDAEDPLAHNNLGLALLDKGSVDESIAEFRTAIELEPKDAKAHNNLGLALRKKGRVDQAIAQYRKAIELDPKCAPVYNNLADALRKVGRLDEAIVLYRKFIELDPRHAQIYNNFADALSKVGRVDEAIANYRKAIELDPKFAAAHYNLSNDLRRKGRMDEAIAELQKAIELDSKLAPAHVMLGVAWAEKGKLDEAIEEYQKAIASDPKYALGYNNLGNALRRKGRGDEAVTQYHKASQLEPANAQYHANLGLALYETGQLDKAVAAYKKAIELDPKDATPHSGFGNVLRAKGRLDEAIVQFHKAIELEPKHAIAHNNLGLALYDKRRLDEAIAEYHKAIHLDPTMALPYINLGIALAAKGRVDEAIAEHRKAIQIDPKHARAHGALGMALLQRGQIADAQASLKRCLELLPANDPLRNRVQQLLQQCERMLALDKKLTAVLKGQAQPADAAEQLALANLCLFQKRYAAAVRFFADAFTAQPKLGDDVRTGNRYNAACAAALAAAGQGQGTAKLDDSERARLRKQALDWLRADLALWNKINDTSTPKDRATVQQTLHHWQQDADLAGIRDKDAVDKLPDAERTACQKLWADVAALLKKCETKSK